MSGDSFPEKQDDWLKACFDLFYFRNMVPAS
jgi:beta-galactosidase